ncbi:hypothetical protein SMQE13_36420 [Serratia marcescens]|nr:hypothetical protein SMQE13_36420 [Serratia marcescens]
MKPYLTVFIQDTNRFFTQGIEHLLRSHFLAKGGDVRFVSAAHCEVVDVAILAEPTGWPLHPCRFLKGAWRQKPTVIITVSEGRIRKRQLWSACESELGVITRGDSPGDVLNLVEKMLALLGDAPATSEKCARCSFVLTSREDQVLRGMACGLTPSRVARVLNITAKTVSAHKCSAMRKLGFRRSGELYHWLRQGGLEFEKRVLS